MSWIKSKSNKRDIKSFFENELLPLSKKQKPYFPLGTETKEQSSYYVDRKNSSMSREDFEWSSPQGEMLDKLEQYWIENGDDELTALIPTLKKLSENLKNVEDQNFEVSPFMYVMF